MNCCSRCNVKDCLMCKEVNQDTGKRRDFECNTTYYVHKKCVKCKKTFCYSHLFVFNDNLCKALKKNSECENLERIIKTFTVYCHSCSINKYQSKQEIALMTSATEMATLKIDDDEKICDIKEDEDINASMGSREYITLPYGLEWQVLPSSCFVANDTRLIARVYEHNSKEFIYITTKEEATSIYQYFKSKRSSRKTDNMKWLNLSKILYSSKDL